MSPRRRALRGARHLPAIAWLWLLWLLLWGSTGAVAVVGGLLVAVVLVVAFPLPPISPGAVARPLAVARLVVHVLIDFVRSGVIVAWQVLRHGGRTTTAIIEVPLRVDSDLLIAAVAEVTTMTPGALVMEVDRRGQRLYVHALPVRDQDEVARRRSEVQDVERRVARVVGHSAAHPAPSTGGPDRARRRPEESAEGDAGEDAERHTGRNTGEDPEGDTGGKDT